MPARLTCFDNPTDLLKQKVCIHALSKDVKGLLHDGTMKNDPCHIPPCKTVKTEQKLELKNVTTNRPCDAKLALLLDGSFVVQKLVTVYEQDTTQRGVHAGDFQWSGPAGFTVAGRISGLTNEGSHRRPHFDPCQKCGERDIMEGRLCGQVIDSKDPALRDCQIIAAYRIKFDPRAKNDKRFVVRGVFEGVIISKCRP